MGMSTPSTSTSETASSFSELGVGLFETEFIFVPHPDNGSASARTMIEYNFILNFLTVFGVAKIGLLRPPTDSSNYDRCTLIQTLNFIFNMTLTSDYVSLKKPGNSFWKQPQPKPTSPHLQSGGDRAVNEGTVLTQQPRSAVENNFRHAADTLG